MKGEGMVGGLLCSEVLAALSEYIDGQLDSETVAKVRAHVAVCHACERFGGSVASSIAALRRQRQDATTDSAIARIRAALPSDPSA